MSYIWTIVGVVFVLAMWVIIYYGFTGVDDAGDKYFAPIFRRHALVLELIKSTKGSATDKSGAFEVVAHALKSATSARGNLQTAQTEHALSNALSELFAHAKADPALETNPDFQRLQAQLLQLDPDIVKVIQYCNAPRPAGRV